MRRIDTAHCERVSQAFGSDRDTIRHALIDVTCSVAPGAMIAVMGPSGSGKSTLLNVLGGLQPPTSGEVTVAGERVDTMTPEATAAFRGRHVGFIFQEWNLLRDLTVIENVALPLRLNKVTRHTALREAKIALDRVGIGDHAGRFPASLSGGEQQRAAIARAVVDGRALLLADEPTGALDRQNGNIVMELLTSLIAGTDRSCVIATHDPTVAAHCDAVWRMTDGRLSIGTS